MKTNKASYGEKAVSCFKKGFNCAQCVLVTMQEFWKIEHPLEPKAASAFGGGIGMRGSLCGALTGGIIAIGLKFGSNEPKSIEREEAYMLASKFYTRFEKESGSLFCRDLIGINLTNPKELETARKSNIFQSKCTYFIEKAIEILTNLK
ncbi:MAG: C_GCAxxG_C_C family protein [Candidatus Bathyarchaeota archaeon]|nr:MAG: C_GCAxxG_C_C family protein [Candidatus Bathyarchaeota archaeon]